MRSPALILLAVLPATLLGCGGGDRDGARAESRVRLTLTAPADTATVRAETIEVRGRVDREAAEVTVRGAPATVEGREFTARVPLEPGANVVDVAATARGARPAFAALRVVREVRVSIPVLTGRDADTAKEQLEGLGLKVARKGGGGLLDALLPGDPGVCESRPGAGAQVLPGSEVLLVVARDC